MNMWHACISLEYVHILKCFFLLDGSFAKTQHKRPLLNEKRPLLHLTILQDLQELRTPNNECVFLATFIHQCSLCTLTTTKLSALQLPQ
jgi:hypothetical protein